MSTYREAHRCATSYDTSTELHQILSRRIIERGWFLVSFVQDFKQNVLIAILFLERGIPFDMTNMATDDPTALMSILILRMAGQGIEKSPSDWSVYSPHHDDYQVPGG